MIAANYSTQEARMKKLLMAGVSGAAVMAVMSPESADAGNPYIALGAGAVLVTDRDYDRIKPPGGPFSTGEIELGGGAIFEGAVGYDAQIGESLGIRFEFQVSNFDVDVDNISFQGGSQASGPPPGERAGIVDHWLLMLNVLVDIGDFGGLVPYVGVGGGISIAEWDASPFFSGDKAGPKFVSFDDETNTEFAWQVIAGASFPVAVNLDLYGNYRLIGLTGGSFNDVDPGGPVDVDHDFAHAFTLGMRYNFL
jgi:opacity protein-like surface antigen